MAIELKATDGVAAERTVYFRYQGRLTGGHVVAGTNAPRDDWYFAEGCVRPGYDTWLCIQNPGRIAASVDIDYLCADATSQRREGVPVPAGSRVSIPVFGDGPGLGRSDGGKGDVAIGITASDFAPVVCERSVYFDYANRGPDWRTIDRTALAAAWGFNEVVYGNRNRPLVAVTFDAGGGAGNCGQLLDVLKGLDVHSTFFVTGRFALEHPDLVRRMAAEGHEVCNHSYSHPKPFHAIGAERFHDELERTEQVVSSLTGVTTRPYFRFPYGERSAPQMRQLGAEGYISIFWTVAGEWYDNEPAETLYSRVMPKASPGAVILLHVDTPSQPAAVASIVPALRAGGLEPVTVTELLLPDSWYP